MKLWSGRFTSNTDHYANHFHSSISFDKRLYEQDIKGSIAHVTMLGKQNIITENDSTLIIDGLNKILIDIKDGKILFDEAAEDIHMNIETLLIEYIGDTGKKLHTGKSRNDQVVLDIRMYLKEEVNNIQSFIMDLLKVLNDLAKEHTETIMPGYTHLQVAQPITFAHHLLAYFEMFKRDFNRLRVTYENMNIMPLGSSALATTTYPLDREYVCELLGFGGITRNSLDAVSDRDFIIELHSDLSLLMMHLSRFCEELIIWSSNEFKFVEISDQYATGSSIMPQKKNPDIAELIRGKSGRIFGNLMGLLTTMKGLPLAYNKDMQEDKEGIFDSVDNIKMILPIFSDMIKTIDIKKENMLEACKTGFINATDAADWLVKNGVPFREAHEIIGKIILYCIQNRKNLDDVDIKILKTFSDKFNESFYMAIDLHECVNARNVFSGPAKSCVEQTIEENCRYICELKNLKRE